MNRVEILTRVPEIAIGEWKILLVDPRDFRQSGHTEVAYKAPEAKKSIESAPNQANSIDFWKKMIEKESEGKSAKNLGEKIFWGLFQNTQVRPLFKKKKPSSPSPI